MGWTWQDSVDHIIFEYAKYPEELKKLKEELEYFIKKTDRAIKLGICENDPYAPCYMLAYEDGYAEELDVEGDLEYLKSYLDSPTEYYPEVYHNKVEIRDKETGNILYIWRRDISEN